MNLKIAINLICLYSCVFCNYAYAQDPPPLRIKPEKGDAYIIVNSPASLIQVAKHLMDNGYEVDKMDTILNVVTSVPRQIPGINGEYYLNIVQRGNQFKIVGMTRFNFTATLAGVSPAKGAFGPARYKSGGSTNKRVFEVAMAFAKSFGDVIDLMK